MSEGMTRRHFWKNVGWVSLGVAEEATLGLVRKGFLSIFGSDGENSDEKHTYQSQSRVYNPANLNIANSESKILEIMGSLKSDIETKKEKLKRFGSIEGLLGLLALDEEVYLSLEKAITKDECDECGRQLYYAHDALYDRCTEERYVQTSVSISKIFMEERIETKSKSLLEKRLAGDKSTEIQILAGVDDKGNKEYQGILTFDMIKSENGDRVFYAVYDFQANGVPDIFVKKNMETGETLYVQFYPGRDYVESHLHDTRKGGEEVFFPSNIVYAESSKPMTFDKKELYSILGEAVHLASWYKEGIQRDRKIGDSLKELDRLFDHFNKKFNKEVPFQLKLEPYRKTAI